ncbi:hypothetical protein AURDEDRAFT_156587 [Auricularia subglabra TFB-10046 SS5]|nr:hypothetical protein AURDEDRAFT_156587 [Auricularia subglabra TFB-10046 SS5]
MAHRHPHQARHLLPASNTHGVQVFIPVVPSERISPFTLGRGTVLWRIWPAYEHYHNGRSTVIVEISQRTQVKLGIPNVLLTVCGVVIGFVLSYRASSGYDRYWMGRSAWGDLMRNARTLARLIWFHIPARLGGAATDAVPEHEVRQVMREKRMAIKMIEGFAVATKHHLRGEMTIYYQDLYPLVVPLHQHPRREHGPPKEDEPSRPSIIAAISTKIGSAISRVSSRSSTSKDSNPPGTPPPMTPYVLVQDTCLSSSPGQTHDALATSAQTLPQHVAIHMDAPPPAPSASSSTDALLPKAHNSKTAYGTFSDAPDSPATVKPALQPVPSDSSVPTSETSSENGDDDGEDHENTPLFPSSLSAADRAKLPKIATELVAFSSFVEMLSPSQGKTPLPPARPTSPQPPANGMAIPAADDGASAMGEPGDTYVSHMDRKHRPRIPGGGENLPLQILWTLSDWLATCERRGTVPGTSLGAMIGTLAAFEDSLTQLEKILMTPLPFVYSVHIRECLVDYGGGVATKNICSVVWVYMFCMPFQLIEPFGIWTIPGVAVAAFFFLGLLAAGEEIEQPFGYDENDLNLDLFANEMVHHELDELAHTAGINVYQRSLGNNGLIADICATRRHKPHPIAVPPNGDASPAPTPLPPSHVAPLTTVPNVGIEVHVIPDHSHSHAPVCAPLPTAPH